MVYEKERRSEKLEQVQLEEGAPKRENLGSKVCREGEEGKTWVEKEPVQRKE